VNRAAEGIKTAQRDAAKKETRFKSTAGPELGRLHKGSCAWSPRPSHPEPVVAWGSGAGQKKRKAGVSRRGAEKEKVAGESWAGRRRVCISRGRAKTLARRRARAQSPRIRTCRVCYPGRLGDPLPPLHAVNFRNRLAVARWMAASASAKTKSVT
jgi:hypothetical protein